MENDKCYQVVKFHIEDMQKQNVVLIILQTLETHK